MAQTIQPRVWFITGASTGFGRDLAEEVLTRGGRVVATARRPEQIAELAQRFPETVLVTALDVTDAASVDTAVRAAHDRFGRIDVLVNNAGYGMAGAVEETSEREFRPMFETNVFGLVRVTAAVLPGMRERKSGHIVNLSSVGGLVGSQGFGFYNATKFAVEGLSEALAIEVAPLGIRVTIVEPGPFRTKFLARQDPVAEKKIADYDETAGKARAYFADQNGKQPGDPARAVRAIVEAVESARPPLRLVLGAAALKRVRTKLQQLTEELDAWETTSVGADFPEGE